MLVAVFDGQYFSCIVGNDNTARNRCGGDWKNVVGSYFSHVKFRYSRDYRDWIAIIPDFKIMTK